MMSDQEIQGDDFIEQLLVLVDRCTNIELTIYKGSLKLSTAVYIVPRLTQPEGERA
jgi:hypothetical protein